MICLASDKVSRYYGVIICFLLQFVDHETENATLLIRRGRRKGLAFVSNTNAHKKKIDIGLQ